MRARGLRPRGVRDASCENDTPGVAFRLSGQRRHSEVRISRLNTRPAPSPVNASPPSLQPATHDSGPAWFATPSLYGSFIHYTSPAFRRTLTPLSPERQ